MKVMLVILLLLLFCLITQGDSKGPMIHLRLTVARMGACMACYTIKNLLSEIIKKVFLNRLFGGRSELKSKELMLRNEDLTMTSGHLGLKEFNFNHK